MFTLEVFENTDYEGPYTLYGPFAFQSREEAKAIGERFMSVLEDLKDLGVKDYWGTDRFSYRIQEEPPTWPGQGLALLEEREQKLEELLEAKAKKEGMDKLESLEEAYLD